MASDSESCSSSSSSLDSPLFTPPASPSAPGGGGGGGLVSTSPEHSIARTSISPPIPGLHYLIDFLSDDEAQQLLHDITQCNYFDVECGRDQAVLFAARDGTHDGLPVWATSLLTLLHERLRSTASVNDAFHTVFSPCPEPPCAFTRQFIMNVYSPGQGIAAHVDLPHRFLDGIMILSLGHGVTMDFIRQADDDKNMRSVYLLPRSLCILTGESRWQWTHGIAARTFDLVDDGNDDGTTAAASHRIERGPRLSITIRWLKIEHDGEEHEHGSTQASLRV